MKTRRNAEERRELLKKVNESLVESLKDEGYWEEGETVEEAIARLLKDNKELCDYDAARAREAAAIEDALEYLEDRREGRAW